MVLNRDERAQARRVIATMEKEAETGTQKMRAFLRESAAMWRHELLANVAEQDLAEHSA